MPRQTPQTTKLETRLSAADRMRFEQAFAARAAGSKQFKRTDLVREAVLFYLDHHQEQTETERNAARDKVIAEALKSIENRFASLMVRLGIDIETLYAYHWTTADRSTREKIFEGARQVGVSRFRKKLDAMEGELKSRLAKAPEKP